MNKLKAYALQLPDGDIAPMAFPNEESLIGYINLAYGVGRERVRKALEDHGIRVVEVKLFTIS